MIVIVICEGTRKGLAKTAYTYNERLLLYVLGKGLREYKVRGLRRLCCIGLA